MAPRSATDGFAAPAVVLAGTHSGVGKSTLTAGLLRALRLAGRRPAPFKIGPDYLDPMLHRAAAGRPSWNLDGWLMGGAAMAEALARGGAGCDLALVEGVMGLFDGSNPVSHDDSTAGLARRLGLPVVLVVDASGVGGSIAATVLGHARLDPALDLAGVIFNRVAGEGHYRGLRDAVLAHTAVRPLGWVPPLEGWRAPERHLGLLQPGEIADLEARLDALAAALGRSVDLGALTALARAPRTPAVPTVDTSARWARAAARVRVGIAWDGAFSFTYADTLDRLERLGVEWVPFSPVRDRLPADLAGVYLPGGYPELHGPALARNRECLGALREAVRAGLSCYAECGGLMLLGEALVDLDGRVHEMAGVLAGRTRMTPSLQDFGYKRLRVERDTLLAPAGAEGRAHEFHCSVWEGPLPSPAYTAAPLHGAARLEGHAEGALLASYCHVHFAAQPAWAESWVRRMRARSAPAER